MLVVAPGSPALAAVLGTLVLAMVAVLMLAVERGPPAVALGSQVAALVSLDVAGPLVVSGIRGVGPAAVVIPAPH
ncbi:hypothetical protein EOD39_12376 [Acipenser ruthenus]|uniref:Uncharacterized protein n=1 Tax=Acipenser ruthenus TaxID=7906 RepID=A0A662YR03_ACIRT|nr:hypothetical protein EOD39_12376 [Acipenser ruthenus]